MQYIPEYPTPISADVDINKEDTYYRLILDCFCYFHTRYHVGSNSCLLPNRVLHQESERPYAPFGILVGALADRCPWKSDLADRLRNGSEDAANPVYSLDPTSAMDRLLYGILVTLSSGTHATCLLERVAPDVMTLADIRETLFLDCIELLWIKECRVRGMARVWSSCPEATKRIDDSSTSYSKALLSGLLSCDY